MEKKLKKVSEGQGFICKDLKEKERIWKRLTEAGYKMVGSFEKSNKEYLCIEFVNGEFLGSCSVTDPLNESDFFDEWTPKAGEWVEVSENKRSWGERQYLCSINSVHICVDGGDDFNSNNVFTKWHHIRQIKPETMTLQEVREALGKPNLVIEG
jgi:hypothetical protein